MSAIFCCVSRSCDPTYCVSAFVLPEGPAKLKECVLYLATENLLALTVYYNVSLTASVRRYPRIEAIVVDCEYVVVCIEPSDKKPQTEGLDRVIAYCLACCLLLQID